MGKENQRGGAPTKRTDTARLSCTIDGQNKKAVRELAQELTELTGRFISSSDVVNVALTRQLQKLSHVKAITRELTAA